MWRITSIGVCVASLTLWAGCRLDTGPMTQPVSPPHSAGGSVDWKKTTEVDVVEQVERCRQEYRQALELSRIRG